MKIAMAKPLKVTHEKRISPISKLCITFTPRKLITNAIPGFTQNRSILPASCFDILPSSSRIEMAFAPEGYPPIKLKITLPHRRI